jgi:biuret amidohydrolase
MTSFDPTRTAVVAVHVQNDVVGTDGAFAGFFRAEIDRTGVLTTISRVLDGARSAGAKVVYTRVAWQPGFPDLHVNSPLLGVVAQTRCLEDGSHGAAIADELTPQQGDAVITHQRAGGFQGSELDATLRDAGIDTVVFRRRRHQPLRRGHRPRRLRPGLSDRRRLRRLLGRDARRARRLAGVPRPAGRDPHD